MTTELQASYKLNREQYLALKRRGKATKEMRADQMVVLRCPCHCGFLVAEPGSPTHLVTRDLSRCDATCKANSFGVRCSHIIAATNFVTVNPELHVFPVTSAKHVTLRQPIPSSHLTSQGKS